MSKFDEITSKVKSAIAAVESACDLVDGLPVEPDEGQRLWVYLDSHRNDLLDTIDRIKNLREKVIAKEHTPPRGNPT